MAADVSLLIPATDPKWFELVGNENLFSATVQKAESCAEIGPVLAAVTPQTRRMCEAEIRKIRRPVTLLEVPESPTQTPASFLRFFLAGMKMMQTSWLVGPHPPFSSFFDSDAFKFSLSRAALEKYACVLTGPFTGWQIVLLHRSILERLDALLTKAESTQAKFLHHVLEELGPQYAVLVNPYRREIAKQTGKPFNPQPFHAPFNLISAGVLGAYQKVSTAMKVPLSELDVVRLSTFIETTPILEYHRPISIWIEISTVNDVPPIYSPLNHHLPSNNAPPYMSLDIFSKVCMLASQDRNILHLSGLGEPLQHPQYLDILKLINEGARSLPWIPQVNCYTDGRGLTEDIAREMVSGFFFSLMIALDAVDEAHYRAVRPTGDFYSVKRNIDRLLELKKGKTALPDFAFPLPRVALTTTLIAELEDHIDTFMTSYMSFHRYMTRFGKNPSSETKSSAYRAYYKEGHMVEYLVIQGASTYAGQNPDRRLAVYTPLKRFPCRRLVHSLFVKTDGSIVLCDRAFSPNAETKIGNVMDIKSFQEAWDRLDSKRKAHNEGRYTEAYDRCGQCEDWFIPVD